MSDPPIAKNSIYHEYGPGGLGWLQMRADSGKDILPAEVAHIIDENPELVDERIREYVLRGLRGDLKKKRGRKRTTRQMLKEDYAEGMYDHLYPRIKARYEREQAKGKAYEAVEYAASELAYAITAKHVGMTWEAVRNMISSSKKRRNSE